MVDPRKVTDRDMFPGYLARVTFISDIHSDIAVVRFEDPFFYNAYKTNELLAILPSKAIFNHVVKAFRRLERQQVGRLLEIAASYDKGQFHDAFRMALSDKNIAPFCMADLESILKTI